jgi:hypothetical protein
MDYTRISDSKDMLLFDFKCPFCSKNYTIKKVWKHGKKTSVCRYNFSEQDRCDHLLMWESTEFEMQYPDEIDNLEWVTRVSGLPFRVWDILQEIINNDELPQNCEVRMRAFYVSDFIVFVFGNDTKALVDAVLEKTKEEIRKYDAEYSLEEADRERFAEVWQESSARKK